MKRNSKILALVIAFAMVMSLFVVPASAAFNDIAGTVTGVSANVVTAEGMVKAPGGGNPEYVVANADVTFENGVFSITNRKYNNCATGVQVKNLALLSGKTYKISAQFRRDSEDVYVNDGILNAETGEYGYKKHQGSVLVDSDEKVQDNIQARFALANISGSKAKVATSDVGAVSLTNVGEWYTVSTEVTVGTNTDGTAEKGVNLTFKVGRNSNNNTLNYSMKNFTVKEVNPVLADIPAGVDILSYIGLDGSFESAGNGVTMLQSISFKHTQNTTTATSAKLQNIKITTEAANSGNKSVMPTTTGDNRLRVIYVPVDAGAYYVTTAYVKLAKAPAEGTTVTARFAGGKSGDSMTNVAITSDGSKAINADTFTKITGVYKTTKLAETNKYSHAHIKLNTYVGNTATNDEDIYVDDWTITELPALTATAAIAEGGVKFTFNSNIKDVTADNFVVTPATATANVAKSGKVVTVTLSDYEYETEYTITTKDITDTYGQPLAKDASAKYTTEEAPFVSPAPVTNNVEVATVVAQAGNRESHKVTNVVDGEWKVEKGAGTIKDTYTQTQIKGDNVQRTMYPVVKGKKYIISALVKNEDDAPTADAKGYITLGESSDSSHNIDAVLPALAKFDISSNDWVEIYAIAEINNGATCDCTGGNCTKNKSVAHYGVATTTDNTSFSVKNITIRELKPLSLDSAFSAFTVDNGDGTATLYITNATETKVYFAAASYAQNGALADVKIGTGVADRNGDAIKITVPENYKVMIWDENFKPLHNTFLGSDF